MTIDPKLIYAYQHTDYVVSDQSPELVLQVGEVSTALDKLLSQHDARQAIFFTADNPRSQLYSLQQNEQRRAQLIGQLTQEKFRFLHGYSRGHAGDWPDELSVLVLNVSRERAMLLARQFEQLALLWIEPGQPIQLLLSDLP